MQDKLDQINDKLSSIDKNVAVNTESLVHHVKRTDLAEQRIIRVENWLLGLLSALIMCIVGALLRGIG